ncbi:hypothetical protein H1R20_g6808, partial [Candolleomyces eurysporus]
MMKGLVAGLAILALPFLTQAQPSPELYERIEAAIDAAVNQTSGEIDYTQFVNPFIGTSNWGNVCPGASIPFGYVANPNEWIRGLSPLHDSGTGSSLGTYGNFEIMPLLCPYGFTTCATTLQAHAAPGYFSLTLDNNIKMEATPTRRAGLERFTFPPQLRSYFVLDLSNDLPGSFAGGELNIDPERGRITISGRYGSSFGPGRYSYQAFACYDVLDNGRQKMEEYGVWTGDTVGLDAKGPNMRRVNLTLNLIGGIYQSGALFSLSPPDRANNTLNIRVGISFRSVEQACANAEEEVGSASFEEIRDRARLLWLDKLKRVEIDLANTSKNVTQMLYSSMYRSFLTPNNATGESQAEFRDTPHPYFDSLYCSWDTYRTAFPFMGLHSPEDYAQIVDTYLDGWRKHGWMPECRANNLPGWTQGGSSADNIVGHFAVSYHNEAAALGIDLEELYAAMVADAELNPPEWNTLGRQVDVYKRYGYVPFSVLDTASTGRQTREGSRTLEYAFEDFAVRQVAQLLGKTADVETYTNRSMGSNVNGFYESSSWEYSWFVPHDTAQLVTLMGGNSTFLRRLDHFFEAGYYQAGNEPSFQTPIGYHYANRPAQSVDRVREVVFQNFNHTDSGLPGNDDQAAMATLLLFHLLGFYPVPGSTQYLQLSPFVPQYTIHNPYLGVSTNVTVVNFDPESIQEVIPEGASAYVESVTVNGEPSPRCYFDFYDTFRKGGEIVITLTANKTEVDDCQGSLPDSLSTGGFSTVRR